MKKQSLICKTGLKKNIISKKSLIEKLLSAKN